MPSLARVLAVLAVLALCAPGIAAAQTSTSTIPQNGGGVSPNPPVDLPGDERPGGSEKPPPPPPAAKPAGALPNTGSDPRLLFLVGVALLLFGTGLRLRTADAELY